MIFLFPRWDMLIPWRVTLNKVSFLTRGLPWNSPYRLPSRATPTGGADVGAARAPALKGCESWWVLDHPFFSIKDFVECIWMRVTYMGQHGYIVQGLSRSSELQNSRWFEQIPTGTISFPDKFESPQFLRHNKWQQKERGLRYITLSKRQTQGLIKGISRYS